LCCCVLCSVATLVLVLVKGQVVMTLRGLVVVRAFAGLHSYEEKCCA